MAYYVANIKWEPDPETCTDCGALTKQHRRNEYSFRVPGNTRVRWGTKQEIEEDHRHYHKTGHLPPRLPGWA